MPELLFNLTKGKCETQIASKVTIAFQHSHPTFLETYPLNC